MANETALERTTEKDFSGLYMVLIFSLSIAAVFCAGGVQYLRQLNTPREAVPYVQSEEYRSGFAKGWSASLTDYQLGRTASPEQALGKCEVRAGNFSGNYGYFERGFVAGYEDGRTIDQGPDSAKISKTAENR